MPIMKLKILQRITNTDLFNRFFKVNIFSKETKNVVQFHGGGVDYNPPPKCEGLGSTFGNNSNNGVVWAWRDEIERKAAPGELRIYAINIENNTVCGEIHLKNDGSVNISGNTIININGNTDVNIAGNANVNVTAAAEANITAPTVNLGGTGGAFVLTENTVIKDGQNKTCTITSNTTKTKAV